jgi:hypothetical protein
MLPQSMLSRGDVVRTMFFHYLISKVEIVEFAAQSVEVQKVLVDA